MLVTAWILFIFFGYIFLVTTYAMGTRNVKSINLKAYYSVVIMVAISAGVIWGGLFQ